MKKKLRNFLPLIEQPNLNLFQSIFLTAGKMKQNKKPIPFLIE